MELGFIYKITCIPTGMVYIGQTKEFKYKQGKPYCYGIKGRWNDHISTSKSSITKFADDIRKFGRDAFKVEELERADLNKLDALEAKWIEHYNSVTPNGYNIGRHSQNKHRDNSNLYEFFQGKAKIARLSRIYKNGVPSLVYVNINLLDGSQRRIVFGNNKDDTFENAYKSALDFIGKLNCEYYEDTSYSSDPLERYASKIKEFETKQITKIRITSASSLIAVYITTSEATSWKDQQRICFGGKTINQDMAYDLAKLFVDQLPKNDLTTIQDAYRCQQQAAAPMDEALP
jgi:hypothetical protein